MKWLLLGVLGVGSLVGVGLAGGLDNTLGRVGERAIALIRTLGSSSLLSPSPPERPAPAARPERRREATAAPPVASATPLPPARIQRSPEGAPGEKLTQDDRDRLNRIIDARLPR